MKNVLFASLLFASAFTAFAGPKEDFVEQVQKQCGKSASEAEALVTPGRTGSVMKFQTCTQGTVDVGGGCTLKCTDKSSSIGG